MESISTQKVPQLGPIKLNSVSRAAVRIRTGDIHPVVLQARKNGPYLVPNTLLMQCDVCLYVMNDSDSQFNLKMAWWWL